MYPKGLPAGRRLGYLAQYFNTVEINSTFYAIPPRERTARWAEQMADRPDFRFTCKAVRTLTHEKRYDPSAADQFKIAMAPLAESGKLGAVLVQFPWFFDNTTDNRARIARIAQDLAGLPLVLELRHRSFFQDPVYRFLRQAGLGLANIDLPASRTHPPPLALALEPVAYFRFHGRNSRAWFDPKSGRDETYNYLYTKEELQPWVERIQAVSHQTSAIFVITNNHYRGQAAANALDLMLMLDLDTEIPETLGRAFPHLTPS